jgi:hypothetical protein
MNWKELDDDEGTPWPIRDVMVLLKDIPVGESDLDEDLSNLRDLIDLHTTKFKEKIEKTITIQRKLNSILAESEDILIVMKRLKDTTGYSKVLEGVEEYTKSLDVEGLTEEYRQCTIQVNEYRKVFASLREIEKYTCSVCLEAMCDTFLDPCGHTVCSDCAIRINKKCPYCRGSVHKSVRMIFS